MSVSALKDTVNIYCTLLVLTDCHARQEFPRSHKLMPGIPQEHFLILISESTSTPLFPYKQQVPLDKHLPVLQPAPPRRHLPETRSCLDYPIVGCYPPHSSPAGKLSRWQWQWQPWSQLYSSKAGFGKPSLQSQRGLLLQCLTWRTAASFSPALSGEGEDLACFLHPWRRRWEQLAVFTTDGVNIQPIMAINQFMLQLPLLTINSVDKTTNYGDDTQNKTIEIYLS